MNFDNFNVANDNETMVRHELSIEIKDMLHSLKIEPEKTSELMKRLFYYMDKVDDPRANREGVIYENLDKHLHNLLVLLMRYKEQDKLVSEDFIFQLRQVISYIIAIDLPEKDNVIEVDFTNKK